MSEPTRTTVLAIQRAVACASPRAWRDLIVTAADRGEATLADWDGVTVRVLTDASLVPGEPVAFHPVADVLATGERWFSARPAA